MQDHEKNLLLLIAIGAATYNLKVAFKHCCVHIIMQSFFYWLQKTNILLYHK